MKRFSRSVMLVIIIYLSFISLGLPDGVLGVAWPAIRTSMGLPLESVGILTTLLLCMSALSSIMSGRVIAKWGTGGVTLASALMTGGALLGFSLSPGFFWIVLLTIPLGLGQGAVDSGLNLYVAQHYSSRHMSWLHCFWGVGATMGPLIMTTALAHGSAWRVGYGAVAAIQLSLAAILCFSLVKRLWGERKLVTDNEKSKADHENDNQRLSSKNAQFLAVLSFFLYTGVEFSMSIWINSVLIESRHMPVYLAGIAAASLYGAIMIGRVILGFIVNKAGNMRMIRLGLLLTLTGIICIGVSKGSAGAITGVVMTGLGMAPVFPCLMHETPVRFKKSVCQRLIGYQGGAANLGGSILSSGIGIALSHFGLELLFPTLAVLLLAAFLVNEWLNHSAKLESLRACKESA